MVSRRLGLASVVYALLNEVRDVGWANQDSVADANTRQLSSCDQLPDEPLRQRHPRGRCRYA
jgi:hypothetical protein